MIFATIFSKRSLFGLNRLLTGGRRKCHVLFSVIFGLVFRLNEKSGPMCILADSPQYLAHEMFFPHFFSNWWHSALGWSVNISSIRWWQGLCLILNRFGQPSVSSKIDHLFVLREEIDFHRRCVNNTRTTAHYIWTCQKQFKNTTHARE